MTTYIGMICVFGGLAFGGPVQQPSQVCSSRQGPDGETVRVLRRQELAAARVIHPKQIRSLFSLDDAGAGLHQLEYRSRERMTKEDMEVARKAQTEIIERAALQGFELNGQSALDADGWEFVQAVCPVFPNHLILQYERQRGPGDISLFTVIVPRKGQRHLRLIPARRQSYSLWSSAPTNALTLNDFNQLVKANPTGLPQDWLTLGLCYAALAGANVRTSSNLQKDEPELSTPILRELGKAGAEIYLPDATTYLGNKMLRMEWILRFNQFGRLDKVKYSAAHDKIERHVLADSR